MSEIVRPQTNTDNIDPSLVQTCLNVGKNFFSYFSIVIETIERTGFKTLIKVIEVCYK